MFCRRRCHAFAFARQIGVAFGPHGNRAIIVTAPRREDEVAEVAGVAREENRVAGRALFNAACRSPPDGIRIADGA